MAAKTRKTPTAVKQDSDEAALAAIRQRFVRRNGVVNPLFVPGGSVVEVIDE